ncbi:glycoside hydrolase family 16 protein [Mucilaginibacter sp. JRF]|uniref:glycoside hydrolase family 16 protein n=1 Tax=Mucilaginibacter sp. JRF TaxID=2780088 RepID=UPI001D168129|nr:glycoside hydrolase family 16 protein [Mucilaginibacter sp. JRF]
MKIQLSAMKIRSLCMLFVAFAVAACKKEGAQSTKATPSNTDTVKKASATIQFSGYTWNIKNTGSSTMGPGPNYWNKDNVWVDSNGWLHLKVSKNTTTNRWECAEVISTQTFGYGTYQWQVDGPLNALDKNVVLGFFNYNGVDGLHEMDIEFARWGVQANQPLNYTIYPASTGNPTFHQTYNFSLDDGTYTTHRFTRTANSVVFKSLGGFYDNDTNLFATSTCAPPYSVSTVSMPVYMNLWLFQGMVPSDNSSVEIVIHSFKFTPL